ncbi:MAG: hypothetical protein II404_00890 [Prevotella sp.]|nr:hypothetical protein [Prevotella sp.]
MKDFENIGKRMPYAESDDYVSLLVERTTEKALHQQGRAKTISLRVRLVAAAAVILLLAGIGITYYNKVTTPLSPQTQVAENTTGPIDDFLNSLSDEDAQLLAYYDIEEIPEYEDN